MASDPNNFESVLQKIHSKYISLSDDDVKKNTNILNRVMDNFFPEMKKDTLLSEYYSRTFYGGSYFDGLRIVKPEEFDLDILLKLPKEGNPILDPTNEPGFLSLRFATPEKLSTEFRNKMLDERNYLSAKKVREWMKSLFTKALNNVKGPTLYETNELLIRTSEMDHDVMNSNLNVKTFGSGPAVTSNLNVNNVKTSESRPGITSKLTVNNVKTSESHPGITSKLTVNNVMTSESRPGITSKLTVNNVKTSESGPAITLKLTVNGVNIDIDFVPCFEFTGDQWPQAGYKRNPVPSKSTFFIVPKSPKNQNPAERYWRLSFQEQERELINNKRNLKPTMKLFKRLRDVQQHKAIASYYIKTIFLLENEKNGDSYWNGTMTETFFNMLEKYIEYIERGNIPYFWNRNNNLLNISSETRDNISNHLRHMQKDLLAKQKTDPLIIYTYLKF